MSTFVELVRQRCSGSTRRIARSAASIDTYSMTACATIARCEVPSMDDLAAEVMTSLADVSKRRPASIDIEIDSGKQT